MFWLLAPLAVIPRKAWLAPPGKAEIQETSAQKNLHLCLPQYITIGRILEEVSRNETNRQYSHLARKTFECDATRARLQRELEEKMRLGAAKLRHRELVADYEATLRIATEVWKALQADEAAERTHSLMIHESARAKKDLQEQLDLATAASQREAKWKAITRMFCRLLQLEVFVKNERIQKEVAEKLRLLKFQRKELFAQRDASRTGGKHHRAECDRLDIALRQKYEEISRLTHSLQYSGCQPDQLPSPLPVRAALPAGPSLALPGQSRRTAVTSSRSAKVKSSGKRSLRSRRNPRSL